MTRYEEFIEWLKDCQVVEVENHHGSHMLSYANDMDDFYGEFNLHTSTSVDFTCGGQKFGTILPYWTFDIGEGTAVATSPDGRTWFEFTKYVKMKKSS